LPTEKGKQQPKKSCEGEQQRVEQIQMPFTTCTEARVSFFISQVFLFRVGIMRSAMKQFNLYVTKSSTILRVEVG
jgi:hypothetical protein